MRILHLPLKGKWYRMIENGEKPEEYRELNAHWIKRIMKYSHEPQRTHVTHFVEACMKKLLLGEHIGGWDAVHFTLGYPKKDDANRNMVKEIKEIVIDKGNPSWGAEEGKYYFVIRLK